MRRDNVGDFEPPVGGAPKEEHFVLRLYVAGTSPHSAQAIENIHAVCTEHLDGRYELEVIDIHQQPEIAAEAQIIAVPTLVKSLPSPLRRLIGNLADREKVLRGLNVVAKPPEPLP